MDILIAKPAVHLTSQPGVQISRFFEACHKYKKENPDTIVFATFNDTTVQIFDDSQNIFEADAMVTKTIKAWQNTRCALNMV